MQEATIARLEAARKRAPGARRRPDRLPALDGLRAVSILLVILWQFKLGGRFSPFLPAGDVGNLGVRIFFVISGFLITTLLLRELDRDGSISLGRFYARRALRIFPPFFAFLAVATVCGLLGLLTLAPAHLLAAATFANNFDPDPPWYLAHLWSLAVEEQFYLSWPLALVSLGRRSAFAAAAVVACAPLVRLAGWYAGADDRHLRCAFPMIADALATGCLLACVRTRLGAISAYVRFRRSRAFWALPAVVLVTNYLGYFHPRADLALLQTARNVAIALCVDRFASLPHTAAGRVLQWGPIRAVGVLSYSLYLWKGAFLNAPATLPFASFPLNLALTFLFAAASYRFLESPLQRIRARLATGSEARARRIVGFATGPGATPRAEPRPARRAA